MIHPTKLPEEASFGGDGARSKQKGVDMEAVLKLNPFFQDE